MQVRLLIIRLHRLATAVLADVVRQSLRCLFLRRDHDPKVLSCRAFGAPAHFLPMHLEILVLVA